jgi:hypothetical protein
VRKEPLDWVAGSDNLRDQSKHHFGAAKAVVKEPLGFTNLRGDEVRESARRRFGGASGR